MKTVYFASFIFLFLFLIQPSDGNLGLNIICLRESGLLVILNTGIVKDLSMNSIHSTAETARLLRMISPVDGQRVAHLTI